MLTELSLESEAQFARIPRALGWRCSPVGAPLTLVPWQGSSLSFRSPVGDPCLLPGRLGQC